MKQGIIEEALDGLVQSYNSDHALDNLATHALPNRRAVIDAFVHLQHALFLGFFSTGKPNPATLRDDLRVHVEAAGKGLSSQIERAAQWADRHRPEPERRCEGWCADAVDQLLVQLPAIREQLRGDVQATFDQDPAAESLEEVVFCYPGVHATVAHRVAHALYALKVPFVPRILSEYSHSVTGIDLHPGAQVGERFCIDHGTGVVVGATAQIGNDVRLFQGVTLGAHSVRSTLNRVRGTQPKRHPTLEDQVTVYAGATILGGDTVVGMGSIIGGSVWLTHSVPPGSRILHRPAQESS